MNKLIEEFAIKTADSPAITKKTTCSNSKQPAEEEDIGRRRKRLRDAKSWSKELGELSDRVQDQGHNVKRNRPNHRKFLPLDEGP